MEQPSLIFHKDAIMVRRVDTQQMALGQLSIAAISIDLKSRDDIPKILRGLQHIYLTENVEKRFSSCSKTKCCKTWIKT